MDHDQRFKALIRDFFGDFLRLFFREWAERLDLSTVTWLDKELLPDPPDGTRHVLDLVAQLRTLAAVEGHGTEPDTWLALVHIEIESPEQTTRLKPRLPRYYLALRDRHECPVLPIVLYLKVGLDGVGIDRYVEQFWELEPLRFQYLYVGLPALDGLQYVQCDNWLGVALSALMRIPPDRVAWLGAEALRRLAEAPLTDQERFLLSDCVQAYLPLDAAAQAEFERTIQGEPYRKVRTMNKTPYDKGLEQGLLLAVEAWLENTFGRLPDAAQQHLRTLSLDQLRQLLQAIPKAKSLESLGLPS